MAILKSIISRKSTLFTDTYTSNHVNTHGISFYRCFIYGFVSLSVLGWIWGCDSRSLGTDSENEFRADGGPGDTGQPDLPLDDATKPTDPCAPMNAYLPPDVRCGDPTPIGWMWNGEACSSIPCVCEGTDCDYLFATESECLEDRAPDCLPGPSRCLKLSYEECNEDNECDELYFGGGCIEAEDYCGWEPSDDGYWICFERGWTCVPTGEPCSNRSREQCHGDCYWWEWNYEMCFSQVGSEECCVYQGFGFCTPVLPGE